MNNFLEQDGRHKLAVLTALVAWVVSIRFNYLGFKLENDNGLWLGWFFGIVITVVELVFNSKTQRLSLTLIVVGIICYCYGSITNVLGFWSFQKGMIPFPWFDTSALMSWFVGLILEILPEPLFMWGIGAELEGDLLGNIVGLWKGTLRHAVPNNSQHKPQNQQNHNKPTYPPVQFRPNNNNKHGGSNRRAQLEQNRGSLFQGFKPQPQSKPKPYEEPTYHPVGISEQKPKFTPQNYHEE